MQRGTLILTGLLAAQLALAGALTLSGSDYAAFDPKEPVIAFEPGKIDQIAIDTSGATPVTLKKDGGKWVIPSFADFPADQTKVSQFLDKLKDLKKGLPVATSGDAAARFKVSDSANERRIVLSSGGKETGKLLVGTSPTFRLANVRSTGNEIYSVAFASHEAGLNGGDWMDREALAIPEDQVASVAFHDVTLERGKEKDAKFALAGVKEGEKVQDTKVQGAARAALRPAYDAVQGKGAGEVAKLSPPDFTFEVKKADGTTRSYTYKKEATGGTYLFAASDRDYVFRVAEASIGALIDARREKLIEQPQADKTSAPAELPKLDPPGAQATPLQPDKTGAPAAPPTPPSQAGAQAEQPQPNQAGTQPEQPQPSQASTQPEQPQPSQASTQPEQPQPSQAGTQPEQPQPKTGAQAEPTPPSPPASGG